MGTGASIKGVVVLTIEMYLFACDEEPTGVFLAGRK
jgi:hypothetical protein